MNGPSLMSSERKSGVKNGTSGSFEEATFSLFSLSRHLRLRIFGKKLCKRRLWRNDHFKCTHREISSMWILAMSVCTSQSTCSLKLIRRIVRPQIWLYLFSIINTQGCKLCASFNHPSLSFSSPSSRFSLFHVYTHCTRLLLFSNNEVVVPLYKLCTLFY